ncbi:MAG: FliO/MopB family protein [Porticoccaceae bacterium]
MLAEFGWSEWLSMMASFMLVIGMLVATLFAIKKLGPNMVNAGNRRLKLLEIQNLGGRQKLLLVSLNGDQVLIGLSPQGMTKLGSWPAVEDDLNQVESEDNQQQTGEAGRPLGNFKDMLSQAFNKNKG